MKKLLLLFALLTVFLAPPRLRAQEVNLDYFYDALSPYGQWLEVPDLGLVWQPLNEPVTWRPYTLGSWAYTDAGWTWVSDEPFGSIVYHFGRWALVNTGWVWVPGTEWGAAWVSFRTSDKYFGWAPLPPEAVGVREHGFEGWVDSYYDLGPDLYSFVKIKHVGSPYLNTILIPPAETFTLIAETRNVTKIVYRDNVVFVGGPDIAVVSKFSEQPIRQLRLERRTDLVFERGARAETFKSQVQGNSLRVFAPTVAATSSAPPARVVQKTEIHRAGNGWANVKGAEALRAQFKKEAPAPAALPPKPVKFTPVTTKAAPAAPGKEPFEAKERKPGAEPKAPIPAIPAPAAERPPAAFERPVAPAGTPLPGKGKLKPFATPAAAPAPAPEAAVPAATPKLDKHKKGQPLEPGAPAPAAIGTPKIKNPEAVPGKPPGAEGGFNRPPGAAPGKPEATPSGKKKKGEPRPTPAAQ